MVVRGISMVVHPQSVVASVMLKGLPVLFFSLKFTVIGFLNSTCPQSTSSSADSIVCACAVPVAIISMAAIIFLYFFLLIFLLLWLLV